MVFLRNWFSYCCKTVANGFEPLNIFTSWESIFLERLKLGAKLGNLCHRRGRVNLIKSVPNLHSCWIPNNLSHYIFGQGCIQPTYQKSIVSLPDRVLWIEGLLLQIEKSRRARLRSFNEIVESVSSGGIQKLILPDEVVPIIQLHCERLIHRRERKRGCGY